jgi:hypothetical protein
LKQLGTNQQRQNTANDQHGEAEQQIQGTNVLVVGGVHPPAPARWGVVVVVVMGVIVMV